MKRRMAWTGNSCRANAQKKRPSTLFQMKKTLQFFLLFIGDCGNSFFSRVGLKTKCPPPHVHSQVPTIRQRCSQGRPLTMVRSLKRPRASLERARQHGKARLPAHPRNLGTAQSCMCLLCVETLARLEPGFRNAESLPSSVP